MLSKSALNLQSKRKRYYSQWGEDGFLEYVLGKLPERNNFLVEFGAWDGKHLSNGFHLIEKSGYTGVLIEMDPERFAHLESNVKNFNCICIKAMVGFDGESKLDSILKKTDLPKDFDLLSVDIDGNDYQVWDALIEYKPKVVIIEINASIFPGKVEINDPNKSFELFLSGSSISAMFTLAEAKGYRMIANIGCNAIFVREDYYRLFHRKSLSEHELFTYEAFSRSQLNCAQSLQALAYSLARPNFISRLNRILGSLLKK